MPGSDHKSNPIQRRQSQRTKKQAQITNMPHPPSTKTKKQSKTQPKKQPNKQVKRKRKDSNSNSSSSNSNSSSSNSDNEEKNIFIEELVKSWGLPKKHIIDYLIKNDYTLSYARGIMKDFTRLLKEESINSGDKKRMNDRGIYSGINTNCTKNLKDDIKDNKNICFCCGEPIDLKSDKACDHVIPIITMLVTVVPDTVPNNLHYIHKSCNTKKSNHDIWTVYKNIGRLDGIFKEPIEQKIEEKNKNNQALTYQNPNDRIEKCKEIFMTILKSIKIRPVYDMKIRKDIVEDLNKNCFGHLQDYVNHYLNPTSPAEILIKMRNDNKLNLQKHKAIILSDIKANNIKDMKSARGSTMDYANGSSSRYSRGNSTRKRQRQNEAVEGLMILAQNPPKKSGNSSRSNKKGNSSISNNKGNLD